MGVLVGASKFLFSQSRQRQVWPVHRTAWRSLRFEPDAVRTDSGAEALKVPAETLLLNTAGSGYALRDPRTVARQLENIKN